MSKQINDFLLKYYSESIDWYKQKDIPEKYKAEQWISYENDIKKNFANYIKTLLKDVDSNLISYSHIVNCSQDFYYCCAHNHKILLKEIKKSDPIFNTLLLDCMHEIDDIGKEYCNTNRQIIDLLIKSILMPESFFREFDNLSLCSWDHFCLSSLIKHESISNYLFRCLEYPNNEKYLYDIIEGLSYQHNFHFLSKINKYLYPEFPANDNWRGMNADIQSSAIEYLKNMDLQESIDQLRELESSGKLYDENRPYVTAALCKHINGEEGLLNLFEETIDWNVKHEIIEYYVIYRSKKFAQFLIDCLDDNIKLENGYYPVRNNAHQHLVDEEYTKLINWFGFQIIEKIDNAILED